MREKLVMCYIDLKDKSKPFGLFCSTIRLIVDNVDLDDRRKCGDICERAKDMLEEMKVAGIKVIR